MRTVLAAIAAVAAVMIIIVTAVAAIGFTPRPFDTSNESAVGMAQNSLGDQYTLDAASLSATWTFSHDAQVVLRFDAGDVTVNGEALPAGCYSGSASTGEVITLAGAQHVSFASPRSDPSCGQLP